jgi:lysyl-tRNA synthetase class 2
MHNFRAEKQRLAVLKPALELRNKLLSAMRSFFLEHGYLEVATPVMVPTPALELHIDACQAGKGYLRTSPELHMKRLLGAGYERIFQIGPCFRSGERGNLHNPEFTMLEWYRAQADYMDILAETKDLLRYVAKTCLGKMTFQMNGKEINLGAEWLSFSVSDLFEKFAGWNPADNFDERRFDEDLVNCVEPRLPKDRPVVLRDYPAEAAALARLKANDRRLAERWELYLGGIEIANAFSELTDAAEQRKRFEECAQKRLALGREAYELDGEFLAALEAGMPP